MSQEEGQTPLSGRFFIQEVGFDKEQMEQFRQINRKFKPKSNQIIWEMDSLKVLIFEELNKQNVDTARLQQLNLRFGELHAELKDETNKFYLKLKEISNTEQIDKLKKMLLNHCSIKKMLPTEAEEDLAGNNNVMKRTS